ncbi:MAG TPA: PAS domain S-box protein, partial [Actinomycetota bacterium]|nr:PAS domain S-box protein [Actinomycetota bacterium]
MVWTTDEDLRVTAAFGEGISGLEVHPRELIGLMIDEILGHDPAAPAVAAHERALRGAPDTYLQEFMGRTFQCRVEPLRQAGRGDGVIGVALDITERAEAERRVMEAELRYRSLVEQGPAVVYSSPARGRDAPEFASPQIEDLLGRSPDEWARDPALWRRSIHPEDRERVAAEWEKAVAGEGAFESEYRMIHADGRVVWVRDQSRLVRDSERRALGWQGVFTDITRARRREQQLRRTNQALRALIEASPLAIAAVDLDGNVTLWNPAAERLFGWTEGDVVGKPIPTIPSRVREEWTVVLDSGSQGAVVSTPETRCLRKDGSEISVEISRAPIRDASGEIVGIFGIFTDITERKRAEQALRASEERYRGLFENALDVVFTTDLTGRFTAVNRAAKRVSGYSRKELLRMNIIDLVASEHRDVVQRVLDLTPPVAQAADAPRARTRYELDIVTKEGRRRSLEAVIHLVWEGDEPVAVEGIARDVTDRKHADEALRASEERYRELFENARDII